jgi:integrase
MRIFKPTRKNAKGKTVDYELWYVELADHLGIVRRLAGFSDKAQTGLLGQKIERLVCCRANNEPLDLELSKWLETLPNGIRNALAKIGLLEASKVAATKPLSEHVEDFKRSLLAKNNTAKHVELVIQRLQTLIDGCGFKYWSEIDATAVEEYLEDRRNGEPRDTPTPAEADGDKPRPPRRLSVQSSNFYLQAVKQFAAWMVRKKRATQSPLDHLGMLNVATDRRHDRRALSVDELRRLLASAHASGDVFGIPGPERSLIYRLAAESGLRSNELRSLTRSSFSFGDKLSTVVVEAENSKHRRRDELPLRPATVELLKAHLASKHPGAKAFTMPRADNMANMVRRDLHAARAAWVKEGGTPEEKAQRERSEFVNFSVGRFRRSVFYRFASTK